MVAVNAKMATTWIKAIAFPVALLSQAVTSADQLTCASNAQVTSSPLIKVSASAERAAATSLQTKILEPVCARKDTT